MAQKQKSSRKQPAAASPKATARTAVSQKARTEKNARPTHKSFNWACIDSRWIVSAGFVLLWLVCIVLMGTFFQRAEQDSFVTSDARSMKFLTDVSGGTVFWAVRYLLLAFKWRLLGGTLLALALTALAVLVNQILALPRRLAGVGFVLPFAILYWCLWRGSNLYYKSEPSLFLLLTLGCLLVAGILALILHFLRKRSPVTETGKRKPTWADALLLLMPLGIWVMGITIRENDLLVARLQMQAADEQWDEMIETARSASRPDRAVAAYHALALEMKDQLLDGMFLINYDYPEHHYDKKDGNEEYGVFAADCNLAAGLVNSAYHSAFDRLVMSGPKVRTIKQLAICAILNEEKELAEKYLAVLRSVPFEGDFIEEWEPLAKNPKLIGERPSLAHIRSLEPLQKRTFEQMYRNPMFLGYNFAMTQGTDAALFTSVAVCLYSKAIPMVLPRAGAMLQKGWRLPTVVQQAIVLYDYTHPTEKVLQQFGNAVQPFVQTELQRFLGEAAPYLGNKKELRDKLKDNWRGSYFYYYYCENNEQQEKASQEGAGVN